MQYDTHLFLFVTEMALKMRARLIGLCFYHFSFAVSNLGCQMKHSKWTKKNGIINCGQTKFERRLSYPVAFSWDIEDRAECHWCSLRTRLVPYELWRIRIKYYNTYGVLRVVDSAYHSFRPDKPNLLRIHWDHIFQFYQMTICLLLAFRFGFNGSRIQCRIQCSGNSFLCDRQRWWDFHRLRLVASFNAMWHCRPNEMGKKNAVIEIISWTVNTEHWTVNKDRY